MAEVGGGVTVKYLKTSRDGWGASKIFTSRAVEGGVGCGEIFKSKAVAGGRVVMIHIYL